MRHFISEEEVNIEWEQVELIERHDSGSTEWAIEGWDEQDNKYSACGSYQDDELIDVTEIERA